MELSLSLEQDARATLFADYRVKSDECLSLLNSLETWDIVICLRMREVYTIDLVKVINNNKGEK